MGSMSACAAAGGTGGGMGAAQGTAACAVLQLAGAPTWADACRCHGRCHGRQRRPAGKGDRHGWGLRSCLCSRPRCRLGGRCRSRWRSGRQPAWGLGKAGELLSAPAMCAARLHCSGIPTAAPLPCFNLNRTCHGYHDNCTIKTCQPEVPAVTNELNPLEGGLLERVQAGLWQLVEVRILGAHLEGGRGQAKDGLITWGRWTRAVYTLPGPAQQAPGSQPAKPASQPEPHEAASLASVLPRSCPGALSGGPPPMKRSAARSPACSRAGSGRGMAARRRRRRCRAP